MVLDTQLDACPGDGPTTFIWTSCVEDYLLSLTLHFLSDWALKQWTLGCLPFEGHHIAHQIAEALDGNFAEFRECLLSSDSLSLLV